MAWGSRRIEVHTCMMRKLGLRSAAARQRRWKRLGSLEGLARSTNLNRSRAQSKQTNALTLQHIWTPQTGRQQAQRRATAGAFDLVAPRRTVAAGAGRSKGADGAFDRGTHPHIPHTTRRQARPSHSMGSTTAHRLAAHAGTGGTDEATTAVIVVRLMHAWLCSIVGGGAANGATHFFILVSHPLTL